VRIKSVAVKPAPSLNLVPKKKHQILVDRDLADVIKRVAGALGYKSMSGLLNDALVCYLRAEYPHFELEFEPQDVAAAMRASADAKQRRLDELGGWSQPAQSDAAKAAQAKPPERRKAERRIQNHGAEYRRGGGSGGDVDQRKKGSDRRKTSR